jgi:hypothetical protein
LIPPLPQAPTQPSFEVEGPHMIASSMLNPRKQ